MPKFSANVNGKNYSFNVKTTPNYVPKDARTWGSRLAKKRPTKKKK